MEFGRISIVTGECQEQACYNMDLEKKVVGAIFIFVSCERRINKNKKTWLRGALSGGSLLSWRFHNPPPAAQTQTGSLSDSSPVATS